MNKTDWKNVNDETIVCFCNKISKKVIVEVIRNGASSLLEIQKKINAGLGQNCKELNPKGRCCHPDIMELISIYSNEETERNNTCTGCCL